MGVKGGGEAPGSMSRQDKLDKRRLNRENCLRGLNTQRFCASVQRRVVGVIVCVFER